MASLKNCSADFVAVPISNKDVGRVHWLPVNG
jgi:hypothetical protein